MQLQMARLCLDCDEVHDSYQCPMCASSHFTYISRWVPAPERHAVPRAAPPPPAEAELYRQIVRDAEGRPQSSVVTRMLVGIGAAGLAGLFVGARRARGTGAASDDHAKEDGDAKD